MHGNSRENGESGQRLPVLYYSVPAASLGVGIAAAASLLLHPTLVGEVVTVAGFLGAGASLVLQWVKSRVIAEAEVEGPATTDPEYQKLRRELTRFRYTEGIESSGERALLQLKENEERFRQYDQLLRSRLSPHELTFQRYYAAAEQAYLAVLDNLERAVVQLKSISVFRAEKVEEQLARVGAGSAESKSLQARLEMQREQQAKLDELFTFNEKALLSLEKTAAAVAEMKELEQHASQTLEDALRDLEELAQRARKYNEVE